MKRIYWTLILAAGLLAACTSPSATRPKANPSEATARPVAITAEHAPDQIVVGYQDPADLDAVLKALGGGRVLKRIDALKAALVELPAGLDASHALGKLRGHRVPGLRYAQPNFKHLLPRPQGGAAVQSLNDPLEAQKWDHDVMQAAAAWATDVDGHGTRPDGTGVVIGVVDTGIDGTHPDLAGAFVNGYDATGCFGGGTIPPGVDASTGHIHGTHVAGIAAARGDNGQGVAGVAYNATLMDLKVFCGNFTDDFTIADAITAAITDADGDGIVPDVITMSLGGKGYGQVLKDAIDSALTGYNVVTGTVLPKYDDGTAGGTAGDGTPDRTVTLTVAMGNSAQDEVEYPAGYPGIIAVGATNAHDEKADFSTPGNHISVSAPGVDILSTWPTWDTDANGRPYLYYRISGTSMATPEVAGAVALLKQFLPGASAYEVRRLLEVTADDIGPAGFDPGTGWGRINLKKLVDRVHDVLAGSASTETGGTAKVTVTTQNLYDKDGDGTVGSADDAPYSLANVDVQLLQGGVVKYRAKTNDNGEAIFAGIAPGTYDVMVAGEDVTDANAWARWPFERVSWDADGDPANGVTLGTLTVSSGSTLAAPDALTATLNSTMKVALSWTGGGDLDLAVQEFDPASGYHWVTPKGTTMWGSFSPDDTGSDPTSASETYTLSANHYPTPASGYYVFSIDATNATVGTTATLTLTMNGVTKSFGPIPIAAGSDPNTNFWSIFYALTTAGAGFDNFVTVY